MQLKNFAEQTYKLIIGEIAPGFGQASETEYLTPGTNPDEIAQNEGLIYYRDLSRKAIIRAGLKHRNISYLWQSASGIPSYAQRQGEIELDPFDRESWEQPPQLLPASAEPEDIDIWSFEAWNIDHRLERGFHRIISNLQHSKMVYGKAVVEIDWQYQEEGEHADKMISIIINNVWDRDPERFVKDPDGYDPGWYLKKSIDNDSDLDPLPPRKFLIFSNGRLENPDGESELQSCVKYDYFKERFLTYLGRHLEKWGSGQWIAKYDANRYGGRSTTATNYRTELKATLRELRNQGVAIVPAGGKEGGLPDIQLFESEGAGELFIEALRYLDELQSIALVGNTLSISQSSHGSYALARSTSEIAKSEYEQEDLQEEHAILNTLIKWHVDFNWYGIQLYPKFQLIDPQKVQPTQPEAKEEEPEQEPESEKQEREKGAIAEEEKTQEFVAEKKTKKIQRNQKVRKTKSLR